MNEKKKSLLTNSLIIMGPVLVVMFALTAGAVDITELGRWDIAISIGAMVSVMIYLFKDKKGKK